MHETQKKDYNGRILVDSSSLKDLCGCGMATAVKIGNEAGAKVKIGGRVLWRVDKICAYLDSISEGA